jgi:hypothetical protein
MEVEMFLLLLILVSIVATLIFVRFNKAQDNMLVKIVAIFCFSFSWLAIVLWFTSLVELWQIALNTPAAHHASIPVGNRAMLTFLQEAVYLLPISRFMLAILYAFPLLLIPLILIMIKRSQAVLILMFSTLANLLFFWIQVLVDTGFQASFMKISIQGMILLTTYALVVYGLVRQRPFPFTAASKFSNNE